MQCPCRRRPSLSAREKVARRASALRAFFCCCSWINTSSHIGVALLVFHAAIGEHRCGSIRTDRVCDDGVAVASVGGDHEISE